MRATLFRLQSNHKNLRTDEVEGQVVNGLPTVGHPFILVGKSLTPGMDARLVETTPVQSVEGEGNSFTFETQNSKYQLIIWET